MHSLTSFEEDWRADSRSIGEQFHVVRLAKPILKVLR
jgi:hypothetical protein